MSDILPHASQQRAAVSTARQYQLELGLDFGTTFIKVSYRVVEQGEDGPVDMVTLSYDGKTSMQSHLAFHNNKFYWGDDLTRKVTDGLVPCEKVIQCAKLALYADSSLTRRSKVVARILEQLQDGGISIEEMLTTLYSAVVQHVQAKLDKGTIFHQNDEGFISNLPVRIRLSAPHDCPPDARQKMLDAAHAIGIDHAQIVSEPIATFAAYLDHVTKRAPLQIRTGECLIEVDLGGGTVDCVKFELLGLSGPNANYRAIGTSLSIPHGSHHVNELLLNQIIEELSKEPGGIDALQEGLGVSAEHMRFRLLCEIEEAKLKCSSSQNEHIPIMITSKGEREDLIYKLSKRTIIKALDTIIDHIIDRVNQMVNEDPRPHHLHLAGQFGTCNHLVQRFREAYEQNVNNRPINIIPLSSSLRILGPSNLVALGSLSGRYDTNINATLLPLEYGYGIQWDEEFTEVTKQGRHYDCTKSVRRQGKMIRVMDPKKVKKYHLDDKAPMNLTPAQKRAWSDKNRQENPYYVIQRLQILFKPGDQTRGHRQLDQILYFCPLVDDPEICVFFVYFTDPTFRTGGPTLADDHDAGEHNNTLRPGILPWTQVTAKVDKDMLAEMDLETYGGANELRYKLYCQVSIECEKEQDMSVVFTVGTYHDLTKKRMHRLWVVPGVHKAWGSHLIWDGDVDAIDLS